MTDRNHYRRVVLPLVFALVVVALAGIALSGAVMAESGGDGEAVVYASSGDFEVEQTGETVDLQDPIYEDDGGFSVEASLTELEQAYLVININREEYNSGDVADGEPGVLKLPSDIQAGDDITVELYETNDRVNQLDTDSTTVSSVDPANFQVTIDNTNSPVTEGDPLEVTATIENTGDEGETKPVELYIGHGLEDDMSVSLAGGESVTRTLSWDTTEVGEYTAMVRTPDDSVSESVVVEEPDPAYFEVTIDSTNSPVTEGDPLEVTATITNTGDEGETKPVELYIGHGLEDDMSVSLAGGESTTRTLSWDTTEVGDYTATVRTPDASVSESVVVEEPDPAYFEVSIADTNSPVEEGNSLDVTARVLNTGDQEATQDIELFVDSEIPVHSTSITLSGGESTSVTLSWRDAGPVGTYTARVSSDDHQDSQEVEVHEATDDSGPVFEVAEMRPQLSVTEGETLPVHTTIENTGNKTGTQTVELHVYGDGDGIVDTVDLELEPGQSESFVVDWQTELGDAGQYTLGVETDDDQRAHEGILVEEAESEPFFDVTITDTNSPVEGETLVVDAEVTNIGTGAGEQTVELRIDGDPVDEATVPLDPEESERLRLSWATDVGDAGEHEVVIASADDTARETVSVREDTDDAYLDVDILGTNTPVEGDDITVRVEVENHGEETGEQEITLDIDGLDAGTAEPVTLDGGASTTLELSAETSAGDSGTYTAVVSSADASDRASVGIRTAADPDPASFGVTIVETNSPVSSGELLEVVVQVENTGDESDRQRLDLVLDGEVRDNTEIQLGPGGHQTVTFEWLTRAGQEGEHELAVMSDDDRDVTTVSVVDEGFIVSALSTNSPVSPGETIHVEAEITNLGDKTDTQTVQLRLENGDASETTRDVQLAGGESETLTWETEASEGGTYELSAQTENHRESTQLRVEADTPADQEGDRESGSTFTVRIDSVEPNGDGTIQIEATVENIDEMEDTQNVVVEHDGVEQGSQEVTLLGGESESLVFSLSPSSDDVDVVDLEVSSETDFDTSSIDLSVEEPDGTDDTDDSDSLLTSPFPYLLVLLLLVVGGGYYYRRRR